MLSVVWMVSTCRHPLLGNPRDRALDPERVGRLARACNRTAIGSDHDGVRGNRVGKCAREEPPRRERRDRQADELSCGLAVNVHRGDRADPSGAQRPSSISRFAGGAAVPMSTQSRSATCPCSLTAISRLRNRVQIGLAMSMPVTDAASGSKPGSGTRTAFLFIGGSCPRAGLPASGESPLPTPWHTPMPRWLRPRTVARHRERRPRDEFP